MTPIAQLIQSIKSADWSTANQTFANVMRQKVNDRLNVERQTIFKEDKTKV